MLDHIRREEVLFLDIETVPCSERYTMLTPEWQQLWEEKSRFICERQQCTPEEAWSQAGIHAEFGKIICISVAYFEDADDEVPKTRSFFGHHEATLLNAFVDVLHRHTLRPWRLLCAHNGKEFDFPYLCRRMLINGIDPPSLLQLAGKKPWEVSHLDTMELWKFGDYKHYTSLRLLAAAFRIPSPKDDISGADVQRVYYAEKDLPRIVQYCEKDAATVALLLEAMRCENRLTSAV